MGASIGAGGDRIRLERRGGARTVRMMSDEPPFFADPESDANEVVVDGGGPLGPLGVGDDKVSNYVLHPI